MSFLDFSILFVITLVPAILWVFIYYKKDFKDPEPKEVLFLLFLFGIFAAIPFVFLRYFISWLAISHPLLSGFFALILFAFLEELAKLLAAVFIIRHHQIDFNQIVDGVIYLVVVALGFAFVENLYYLHAAYISGVGWSHLVEIYAIRSLGTMLGHAVFSGLLGLIWAYAYFSKEITPFNKKRLLAFRVKDWFDLEIFSLHIIRCNVLRARPSRRGGHDESKLVYEGVVLAVGLHVLFNFLVSYQVFGEDITFLVVPFLMIGFFYFSYLFTKSFYTKILKVI